MSLGTPYRRLWSATLLSNVGDGIRATAFPLLAASLTSDPLVVAGVGVAAQLPGLLMSLTAGSLADRFDRRRLILVADSIRLILLIALMGLIAGGWSTVDLLYAVVFVCGVTDVVRAAAASTLTPSIVDADDLDRANGQMVTAEIAGNEFVGPPLGGFLFGVAVMLPFAVNGGTLAIAVALIVGIPTMFKAPRPQALRDGSRRLGQSRAGLSWVASHPRFWAVPATTAALALTDSAWFTLLVLYLRQVVHADVGYYGLLLALGAVGGVTGGMVAATLSRRAGPKIATLICLTLSSAGQLALGTTGSLVVTAVVLATSSMAFAIWNVQARTTIQRTAPPALLGRVLSVNRAVVAAASLLGALLGGVTADHFGLQAPFLLGVPILLAATALVAASRTSLADNAAG